MDIWTSFGGTITASIISAVPEETLTYLNNVGIPLSDIKFPKPMTAQFQIKRVHYPLAKRFLEKKGIELRITKRHGLYWRLQQLKKRPVLLAGFLLFLFLSLYLPGRVLFVRVSGNDTIPERLILEQAEFCGITFGASRREVRSEKIKNSLLYRIPELEWAGVNTSGCVATITVKERERQLQINNVKPAGNLVAIRDAIIKECTVYQGTQLCKVGQAVRAGEVLVSGYTDCGISVKFSRANAEIYGQTMRQNDVVALTSSTKRGEITETKSYYSLQIGKILINFYSDSGISDIRCVKMYTKQNLTLPGGFTLPVALITQTRTYYGTENANTAKAEDFAWLASYMRNYISRQMVAGKILQSSESLALDTDTCTLTGQYTCREMIGRVREEEIVKPNE